METSPDSPYLIDELNDESHKNLHSLVKINSEGISNQWMGSHTVFNEIDKKNFNREGKQKKSLTSLMRQT